MRKSVYYILLVLALIGGYLFYQKSVKQTGVGPQVAMGGKPGMNGPARVNGYVCQKAELLNTLNVSGSLLPSESVVLYPEISGRVVQIAFREGQRVSKGSLLFKLNDDELQARLKKLQGQEITAAKLAERLAALLKVNGIGQQEADEAKTRLLDIQADIQLIQAELDKTMIRAPFDGVVGLRNVSEGARVTNATALTTVVQPLPLKLEFQIPEYASCNLREQQEISFVAEGGSNPYTAKVYAREPAVEAGTRTIRVRALVTGNSQSLMPGGFVTVQLSLGQGTPQIAIPTSAIIPQGRKSSVLCAENGIATFREVTTGVRSSGKIAILSGLEAGDTIITSGMMFVKPGTPVLFKSIVTP